MKKLLALLVACTTMTCIFASCGEDEKDESSVSGESSVSEEASEETTTEISVEEETTVSETEAETEEDTEITTHEYIDADATAFLGKWECESMVIDGEELTDFMGIPIYAMFQFDIKEGGTANTPPTDVTDTVEYTWGMISENEIEIVSEDGTALTFVFEGDKLAGHDTESDDVIYLIKVDDFTPFNMEEFMNESSGNVESTDENSISEEESETIDSEETTTVSE